MEQRRIGNRQNEFSHWQRRDEHNGVLHACEERGIAYLPYSPFGGDRAKGLGAITAVGAIAQWHGATPYSAQAINVAQTRCVTPHAP